MLYIFENSQHIVITAKIYSIKLCVWAICYNQEVGIFLTGSIGFNVNDLR